MSTDTVSNLSIPADWLAEFEAAARRPLEQRFRYSFIKTYKPVLDDAEFRSFDSTEEYRNWCEDNLPDWLGYGVFEYRQAEEIRDTFNSRGVRYLFIGKSGAILLGYPDTTQDADLFVEKDKQNCKRLVQSLRDLGFDLTDQQEQEILRGKDFVQLKNGPFDLDLIFTPDGIEHFSEAWERRVEVEGFSVCHIDDIIASKVASGRVKDRESLPRLQSFREYWISSKR